ncbi:MAG: outer membrane protein nutrient binding [Daejeonella sp.]|nr:outer membrane protein nutrient binding [Daejeonella sp.]
MKIFKKKYKIACIALALFASACTKELQEKPYTAFTTEYFKTEAGIQDAINTLYAGMRYNYGPNGALGITNVGTDEFTYGDQPRTGADGDVLQLGSYLNLSPNNGSILTPWNRNYSNINLCNGVIAFSEEMNLPADRKATIQGEAHFIRALYYMLLVQQFGAVPVNLGAGDLAFNDNPGREFFREPREELLVKDFQTIVDDLTFATQSLPDQRPANQFKLSKAAAFHLLAKAYVYRGYSAAKQATDFQSAYSAANELITNKGKYGVDLLPDYGDVHKVGNDYNKEILFSIERLTQNNAANEVVNPGSDFSEKVNIANNMFNANYQSVVPASYPNATIAGKGLIDSRPLIYGRPLRRYAPNKYVYDIAFAEKTNDSRYENSFRVVWKAATFEKQGTAAYDTYVAKMSAMGFALGDTVIYLAPTNEIAASLKTLSGTAKKKYWVVAPSEYYSGATTGIQIYPNLKKYDDPNRAAFNDVSGRPFIVSKLSEVYLLGAEAAMQIGNPAKAAELINVLRRRAAYRPSRNGRTADQNTADNVAAANAMDITAAQITLDFILEERTRELCGESVRWPDLAMRGKLVERVKAYNPDAAPNIKDFHVLRPIPQSQLDAISNPNPQSLQNPGY